MSSLLTQTCKPFTSGFSCAQKKQNTNRTSKVVRCSAQSNEKGSDRRSFLMAGLMGVASLPLVANPASAEIDVNVKEVPVSALNTFQKGDIVAAFKKRAESELKKVLVGDDASKALRLLLNDAASYDATNNTGGCNGSIILSGELDTPQNKDLKPYVEKLAAAKKAIDASAPKGQAPISWADTIVLGCKVALEAKWAVEKLARAQGDPDASATKFPAAFPVAVGRVDATTADPGANRIPANDASPETVLEFMKTLGVKPDAPSGPFDKKAPFRERQTFLLWTGSRDDPAASEAAFAAASPEFAELKKKYDLSRKTFTRTNYEIDLIDYVGRLANLGAKLDSQVYLFPLTLAVPKKL